MKKSIIFLVLTISTINLYSQSLNNLHSHKLSLFADTTKIDSLVIIPETIKVTDIFYNDIPHQYFIDFKTNNFICDSVFRTKYKRIIISYSTLPESLTKSVNHKNTNLIVPKMQTNKKTLRYQTETIFNPDNSSGSQLVKQGSISRGITIGNNQDAVVNSSLNLQMSGKIYDDIEIQAAITDNNIPIQPDGNTNKIQDFNKVYIKLFNPTSSLIVGDFEVANKTDKFMSFNKNLQGAMVSKKFKSGDITFNSKLVGAVAKGIFARKIIAVIEGIQGPYRLYGNNNELNIIVIAGSEKVYVDGKLMKRGADNDYTIDYNTSEITFTTTMLVTKDKRVIVEFEYSDLNFTRYFLYSENQIKTSHFDWHINYYLESDNKNQPYQQALTDAQKQRLSQIGDSVNLAVFPSAQKTTFNNNFVMYKKIDSTYFDIHSNLLHDSIFVYSTNPDSANYTVSFSMTANNGGDYVQITSTANGRVFKWIAPKQGIHQGNFIPMITIVPPQKKQLFSVGTSWKPNKTTNVDFEFCMSNFQRNTFSSLNNSDDNGFATFAKWNQKILLNDTSLNLNFITNLQYIDKNFSTVERYNSPEFERDFNVRNLPNPYQQNADFEIDFSKYKLFKTKYQFNFLDLTNYQGIKNNFDFSLTSKPINVSFSGSLLTTTDSIYKTKYLTYKVGVSKPVKFLILGANNQYENNEWNTISDNKITANSFRFNQYEIYCSNRDTAANTFLLKYTNRTDFLPFDNALIKSSAADEFSLNMKIDNLKNQKLKIVFTYRRLEIDSAQNFSNQTKTGNLGGRIDYSAESSNGAWSLNTFYEISSAQEPKPEYTFIEVPAGQGIYKWTDYNGDGVKQINEFEIATFKDEAKYIRVPLPSLNYEKIYSRQINQTLQFFPERFFSSKKSSPQEFAWLKYFSDALNFRLVEKSRLQNYFNPVFDVYKNSADTNVVNQEGTIRNTFSVNKNKATHGLDYIYQNSTSRSFVNVGYQTTTNVFHSVIARFAFTKKLFLYNTFTGGQKTSLSQYFTTNDYKFIYYDNELSLKYQKENNLTTNFSLEYKRKDEQQQSFFANHLLAKAELNYIISTNGNLSCVLNYVDIKSNLNTVTPLSNQMLDGLKNGQNFIMTFLMQRKLSDTFVLMLNYSGRLLPDAKMIHTGGMEIKAYF